MLRLRRVLFKGTTWGMFLAAMASLGFLLCSFANEQTVVRFPPEPPRYPMYDFTALHDETRWTVFNVHDPAVGRDGAFYYLFSTDVRVGGPPRPGIQVRRSRDLIRWEWFGYAFDGIPQKALEWVPKARGIWAPDVVRMGDFFFLYYSVSTFGSNRSYIGVARSRSLAGPWEDLGEVIKTQWGDEANAIDPQVVFDRKKRPWLVYGSHFGGIYITPLDPKTGKAINPRHRILLARRPASVHGSVEGAFIAYHPEHDYFYLFVSYDSLFRDYNVRVARAKEVTGPYLDYNGRLMTDVTAEPWSVGSKILGGYRFRDGETWIAPGHCSVLKDKRGWFMIHHAREQRDLAWSYLHVRKMVWTKDGWPLVSPQRFAGERTVALMKNDAAFLFPGQGSQRPGMGRDVYEGWEEARAAFDEVSRAAGFDVAAACLESAGHALQATAVAQPAMIAVDLACAAVLAEAGEACGVASDCGGAVPELANGESA